MSPYKKQIQGSRYQKFKIQPSKFINDNRLLAAEANVIKYVCRHQDKGKENDIKKAIHYCEMILARDYGIK